MDAFCESKVCDLTAVNHNTVYTNSVGNSECLQLAGFGSLEQPDDFPKFLFMRSLPLRVVSGWPTPQIESCGLPRTGDGHRADPKRDLSQRLRNHHGEGA